MPSAKFDRNLQAENCFTHSPQLFVAIHQDICTLHIIDIVLFNDCYLAALEEKRRFFFIGLGFSLTPSLLLGNVTAAGNGTAGSPGTSREQVDADWL